jgi:hypothetical protein
VWLKLCTTYEGSSEIKSSCRYTTIGNIKLFLRNLESPWMIVLLDLNLLSVAYVLVVHLLILIMNVLNNCCTLWTIMFAV